MTPRTAARGARPSTDAARALLADERFDPMLEYGLTGEPILIAIEAEARDAALDEVRVAIGPVGPHPSLGDTIDALARVLAILDALAGTATQPADFGTQYAAGAASRRSERLIGSAQPAEGLHRQADELGHATDGRAFHEALCPQCGLMLAYLVRDQIECTASPERVSGVRA